MNNENDYLPIGVIIGKLTKKYISILTKKLEHVPIERSFYPLWLIGKKSGKITQNDLVALLDSDKVTVFRYVEYLEKEGMIVKKTNPNDKRCQLLFVSDKAMLYINEIEQAFRETDALFKTISENPILKSELHHLLTVLDTEPGELIELSYSKLQNNNINNNDL